MDVTIGSTSGISSATPTSRSVLTEQQRDNVAREEQKELVSKSANDAIRGAALAGIKFSAGTTAKAQETPKSLLSKSEISDLHAKLDAKYGASGKAKEAVDAMFAGSDEEISDRVSLFMQVTENDDNISPLDFTSAQKDLAELKKSGKDKKIDGDEVEKLTKLSLARHLLGPKYPTEFAVEMVDLDKTISYKQKMGMREGVEGASRGMRISSHAKAGSFGLSDDTDIKGLAGLSAKAYGSFKQEDVDQHTKVGEYTVISPTKAKDNGFAATAFKDKNGNIVIAYRGSDDVRDIKSDLEMVNDTELPEQFKDAQEFFEQIKEKNPNSKIILTGHSLGGALSQLVAAKNEDAFAVAFNAPGTKSIIERSSGLSDSGNIYNVIVDGDVISGTFAQPGVTQLIDVGSDKFGNKYHPHAIFNCT